MGVSPANRMVIVMAVTADEDAVCVRLAGDIDLAAEPDLAMTVPCSVTYVMSPTSNGKFEAMLTVTNATGVPVSQWTVAFSSPAHDPSPAPRPARPRSRQ